MNGETATDGGTASDGASNVQFRKAPDRSRYEATLDGAVIGVADYRDDGDDVLFPHVEVEPQHGGQGIAGRLTAFALDDVRAAGRSAVPICPFVVAFVQRNPQYADLVSDR